MLGDQLVECIPNVSEGRQPQVIQAIGDAVRSVANVTLLDVNSDVDHHRSVFTFAGPPTAVAEAAFRLAEAATRLIDLTSHQGVHPRIGAVDVIPFVPLGDTPMATCVALAHEVGDRIANTLEIPVYFYGEAATQPERRALANIRRGEYEGLHDVIASDPARAPDRGPRQLGRAGAVAVGARPALIAFNMHLRTADVSVAHQIARTIRASSGGLPGVQALGLTTSRPGITQLSMNLIDVRATPLVVIVERVRQEANRFGVELAESELVGLMPASALLEAGAMQLGLPRLTEAQVIELAVAKAQRHYRD